MTTEKEILEKIKPNYGRRLVFQSYCEYLVEEGYLRDYDVEEVLSDEFLYVNNEEYERAYNEVINKRIHNGVINKKLERAHNEVINKKLERIHNKVNNYRKFINVTLNVATFYGVYRLVKSLLN